MSGILPAGLTLDARLGAGGARQAAGVVAAALAESPLGAPRAWAVPAGAGFEAAGEDGLPAEIGDAVDSAAPRLADGSTGSLYPAWDGDGWAFTLDLRLDEAREDALPRAADALLSVARALLRGGAARVSVAWQGRGALCLPEVPVACHRTHVVTATDAEVAAAYADPAAFWESGWSGVERHGDRALLWRAPDARDSADFLRAVLPQQWALARAARPRLTRYALPSVEPGEEPVYRAEEPVLQPAVYDAATGEVELACGAPPPAHVPGWQVFDLLSVLQAGALDDGRPVRSARVVFLFPEAAREEKRPLLDVGARVMWYDEAGMLVEEMD